MSRFAALEIQRPLRDLAALPRLCSGVGWLDVEDLAVTPDPAVLVGVWLAEEPGAATRLLALRSGAGLTTVIVPRFKAGELRAILKAPSSVRIKNGEFDAFSWDDGETIAVAGQTVVETALHTSKYGSIAGVGTTVLSYRSHEAAGAIVVCTPGLTSRQLGVDLAQQRRLLELILARSGASPSPTSARVEPFESQTAATVDELLARRQTLDAAVVLALALGGGDREVDRVASIVGGLGFGIGEDDVRRSLDQLPEASVGEMERALRKHGWGAFLRHGRLALAEGVDA